MPLRPILVAALALLSACGISSQEARDLARYQHNAQLYWEGNKLDQAMMQIERGLAIDPDDYKLRTLQAMVRLRQGSGPAATTPAGAQRLDEAERLFASIYATRDPQRHERQVLLGYGMALQSQGMRHLDEARVLEAAAGRAERTAEEARQDRARAKTVEAQGRRKLEEARAMFAQLEERGEMLRLASYHLVQVAAAQGDHEGMFRHAEAYLKANARDQEWQRQEIARTANLGYERERRAALQQLRLEEIDVRELLANVRSNRKEYAEALPHLDAVLEADPGRWALYYERGVCRRALGRADEAKADFRRFLATSTLPASHPKMTEAVQALGDG